MDTGDGVRVARKNGIATITLARPETLNVLDTGMLTSLGRALEELEGEGKVRTVLLTGGKHFSAGADIREMAEKTPGEAEAFSRLGHAVFRRLETLSRPVIAAISGAALGGGCELALACDLRLAGASARFGQPEVSLGLVPGFGGTVRLGRLVGEGRARELILSGRIIEAAEAAEIGLVSRVVPDGELMERAEELAILIARKSPAALRTAKEILNGGSGREEGLEREVRAFARCFASPDRAEGIAAFLEKRPARFRDPH